MSSDYASTSVAKMVRAALKSEMAQAINGTPQMRFDYARNRVIGKITNQMVIYGSVTWNSVDVTAKIVRLFNRLERLSARNTPA